MNPRDRPIRDRGYLAAAELEKLASRIGTFPDKRDEATIYRKCADLMRMLADAITQEPERLVRERRWNFQIIEGGKCSGS